MYVSASSDSSRFREADLQVSQMATISPSKDARPRTSNRPLVTPLTLWGKVEHWANMKRHSQYQSYSAGHLTWSPSPKLGSTHP